MSDYILVTHWTGGDVYPFIRLGKMLKREGHKVTIVTHCIYEENAKSAGLDFVAVDTLDEYESMNRDLPMLTDPIGHKDEYVHFHIHYHGKERLLREVDLIEKVCSSDSIIIARNRSSISGLLVAEKNHLRYASMILAPNYFSHMELHNEMFGNAFCEEINKAREALQLPPISDWKDWLYSPKVILCGWPRWYADRDETWAEGATPIGFLEECDQPKEIELAQDITDFLNEAKQRNKKIAIVTGGSARMANVDFYRTAIHSCILAGVYTIAITPYDECIPQDIPETVKCVRYVPLRYLMTKVDLVIHHGGMGSINDAIDAEIAQIVMPHMIDGPDNADRLAALGIATKFPPKLWDPTIISQSITEQLGDQKKELYHRYKEMNKQTYDSKLWKNVLENLESYELPPQKEKLVRVEKSHSSRNAVSRDMLLKIMKKKQESKE